MSRLNWVYIMTNKPYGTLYTGSTSDLLARIAQHREGTGSKFVEKYGLTKLVYYEECVDYDSAINEEHRIKKWRRQWKINMIEERNPNWDDLWDEIRM